MITDEQFEACRLAANESYKRHKGSIRGQIITPEDDWEWHFARELIALAQQVKPLAFVKTGDYDNSTPPVEHYSATTEFGIIELIVDGDGAVSAGFLDSIVYDRDFTTLTKAIEAANEDYQRRVLSCLVWGEV